MPESILKFNDPQSRVVLIGEKIFNENELNGRIEVELEKFTKKVQIESRVLGDLAINHIVPTAVIYENRLLKNLHYMKELFSEEEYEEMLEYCCKCTEYNLPTMNLHAWHKGAPRHDFTKLDALKKDLNDAIDNEKNKF